jgi:hypothetical protein
MRRSVRRTSIAGLGVLLVLGFSETSSAQDWGQKHSAGELLEIATSAYQTLPEVPSSANAKSFLVAFANLSAYAEISPRVQTDAAHASAVRGALEWLSSNLRNVVPAGVHGKVDAGGSSRLGFFERRGLAAYDSLRHQEDRVTSAFESYVAAVTNLYVVRQAQPTPSSNSTGALRWLTDHPVGLSAGVSGKADAPGSRPVLPTTPKPDLFGSGSHAVNLSGRWAGNDGGTYYIRQVGDEVWWFGESANGGKNWSNVFHGSIDWRTHTIRGQWIDIPKGATRNRGKLVLRYADDGRTLSALQRTGGFGGSMWHR